MVVDEGEQVLSLVQSPVVRAELAQQRVIDLEHVHGVKTGIQSFVALIVCYGVQHGVVHDLVVIAVYDLADQEEIWL